MIDFDDLKNMINEGNVDHLYINDPQCYMIKVTDLISMFNIVEENVKYCYKIELLDALHNSHLDKGTLDLLDKMLEVM